jgi:acetylornithine deacetylase/succinyl-diaminopimelate desuccinylase-like protein
VLPLLLNSTLSGFVLDRVIPDPSLKRTLSANLSNTASPTILDAGMKTNVIPGSAEATLDGRLLPGQTSADLFREIRELIGEGFEYEIVNEAQGREETADDDLYSAICENIRRHDPNGIPLPYMVPGFTDAQQFGRLGTTCYGYSPIHFPAEDEIVFSELFHGHNERIHVDGYKWGLRCLWDLVRRFTTA